MLRILTTFLYTWIIFLSIKPSFKMKQLKFWGTIFLILVLIFAAFNVALIIAKYIIIAVIVAIIVIWFKFKFKK